jgi:hypothetical protein
MSGKMIVFGIATFLTMATAHAEPASPAQHAPGKWRHETRPVGTRTTVDVFHREPYALTGNVDEPAETTTAGRWEHRLGPRGPIDVYRR